MRRGRNGAVTVPLPTPPLNRAAFEEAGFRAEDARIDRLRPPPLDAVRRFFRACDAAGGGAIAVHCRTGRGRAAAMAGLWLMREYGLTAREATVWLRLVRPGPARLALRAALCTEEALPDQRRPGSRLWFGPRLRGESWTHSVRVTTPDRIAAGSSPASMPDTQP